VSSLENERNNEAFRQGLRDLGYIEGQNIVIEYRWAEGREERLPALAAELVQLNVEVLVAASSAAIRAAQHATRTIPIVMAGGLEEVANQARPEGNITGTAFRNQELSGKRLELLQAAVPHISRMALLGNPANPNYAGHVREAQAAAQSLGIQLDVREVRSPVELEHTFVAMRGEGAGALLVLPDGGLLLSRHRSEITALALKYRLPAIYPWKLDVEVGGLMSYAPSLLDMYRRAAYYVDKILKGAKPGDLPVEQPMKFELIINLKTAKALGMTLPPALLLLADEVIQ
jgi:putative ABC transport system substrate-binding protein